MFYLINLSRDPVFKAAVEFDSEREAGQIAARLNKKIVMEDYGGIPELWKRDQKAVHYTVITENERKTEYQDYLTLEEQ